MVIVDSSVWIDLLNGRISPETRWLGEELHGNKIGLTTLILHEVLRGFRYDREFRHTRDWLMAFPVYEDLPAALAIKAAEHFRTLQRQGITIRKSVDCLIAAFCIQERYKLLHNDSDFLGFEKFLGLETIRL
jgi:hypothetical protein